MASIRLKRNDTRPSRVTLVDAASNPPKPVNLTTAQQVVFLMDHARTHVDVIDRKPAVIVDAANGLVEYQWDASDTASVGVFNAEFEVTWSDGTVETFPVDGYIQVTIQADLG